MTGRHCFGYWGKLICTVLFAVLALPGLSPAQTGNSIYHEVVTVRLGESIVALNGPWKYHTGDDARWADPDFDDSAWETIDLKPAPGAHDSDVGLTGYVPGWTSKGHPGYWGYAWYRIRLNVEPHAESLALLGPFDVDNAYQLFSNGRLLGGVGNFSRATPAIYSPQPRIFPLRRSISNQEGESVVVLAVRVWMAPEMLGSAPDVGGIHIAPAIGDSRAIQGRYRLQWLEIIRGYFLEILQGIAFTLLAVMSCSILPFDRSDPVYLWLTSALVITGLVRTNLAFGAWTQWESAVGFDVFENALLFPLMFAAWTMTWWHWFQLRRPVWVPRAAIALMSLYVASRLLSGLLFDSVFPHSAIASLHILARIVRLCFAALLLGIAYAGIRQQGRNRWLALISLLLAAIGLFAQELSSLHVPSIWFPFGTGVSRTQFAYAALDLTIFALLFRRLLFFAPHANVRRMATPYEDDLSLHRG